MSDPILSVRNLSAGYDDTDVLQAISLEIQERNFIGIIGPNGSGKSTFMQVLARSLPYRSGEVLLIQSDLRTYSFRDFGKIIGYVPQESEISFQFSVYDVVMMGRNPHLNRFQAPSGKDHEIVRNALIMTGTEPFAERPVTALSGGERQRVMIARVLAQDPSLLLLDEPFAHIDIHHQYELIRIIRSTSRDKRAVIGVFHDINLAAAFCDKIVLMYRGRVFAYGTPDTVLTEENIREVFTIEPVIGINPTTGGPWVYVGQKVENKSPTGISIHIISGGGTGGYLIPLLQSAGNLISMGILSENDSDYTMAKRFDVETFTEPPFTKISLDKEQMLATRISIVDRVILTAMPVGWGNFSNIRILEKIPPEKVIIIAQQPEVIIPDFTEGAATQIIHRLLQNGARYVNSIEELLSELKMKV